LILVKNPQKEGKTTPKKAFLQVSGGRIAVYPKRGIPADHRELLFPKEERAHHLSENDQRRGKTWKAIAPGGRKGQHSFRPSEKRRRAVSGGAKRKSDPPDRGQKGRWPFACRKKQIGRGKEKTVFLLRSTTKKRLRRGHRP